MFSRAFTIFVFVFWLASTAWLVRHDIAPAWTAQDVPKYVAGDWLNERVARSQSRIEDKNGERVGTVWTEFETRPSGLSRTDLIHLQRIPQFEGMPHLPSLRIFIESDYSDTGDLDTFRLRVLDYGERVELLGERYGSSLAFRLDIGTEMQLFKVDASVAGMIADAFNPFPTLPSIEVGQSWRMHVVNPVAALTGVGQKLVPMLVRVTGKTTLTTYRGPVECFVVEAGRAKAWVDADGVVLQQEIELPYGGRYRIINEPYDESSRKDVDPKKHTHDIH